MKTPLFISASSKRLPNWVEAFSESTLSTGLPARFDTFDNSLIFVDYMNLTQEQKQQWLEICLATDRMVFVLSPTPNEREAIEVIKTGAVGYGHTLSAANRLREMVLVANHGGLWIGNKLLRRVMSALGRFNSSEPLRKKQGIERFAGTLSAREMAVGGFVARGFTNAEISSALEITERTVKAHITSIFEKLKVRNRVELALLLNNVEVSRQSIDNSSKRTAL